jgi:hypothetical protein
VYDVAEAVIQVAVWCGEDIMAQKTPVKTVPALTALKALQEDAKRKGLDKMTMDEINAEVTAYRRERRAKAKSDSKAR